MSGLELGFWSFPVLLVMVFLRAPIGLAMMICGFGGWFFFMGGNPTPLLAKLKSETYTTFSSYSLSIIPMFLLMGQFATLSGMSTSLFKAAESFLGHRRGGVAMASVGACAGFGAICGSSLATAATMSKVALPELRRYGYSGGFSTATLAAGGTLGILIPPSVILVIYAILTEQNIAKLFLAAFIPGILAALGYIITISIYVRLHPDAAGTRPAVPMAERFKALAETWPVLMIFFVVVGGIYLGWFTPTEGSAVGAAGTGLAALLSGSLNWALLRDSLLGTAKTTAMIFFIVLGAGFYNGFLALSGVPQFMADWVQPAAGAEHHPDFLPDLWLPDGQPVDDPADGPDLFPGDISDGFRDEPRTARDLVWHLGADRGRGGADHATCGHEPFHHQRDGPRHPDNPDLQGGDVFCRV